MTWARQQGERLIDYHAPENDKILLLRLGKKSTTGVDLSSFEVILFINIRDPYKRDEVDQFLVDARARPELAGLSMQMEWRYSWRVNPLSMTVRTLDDVSNILVFTNYLCPMSDEIQQTIINEFLKIHQDDLKFLARSGLHERAFTIAKMRRALMELGDIYYQCYLDNNEKMQFASDAVNVYRRIPATDKNFLLANQEIITISDSVLANMSKTLQNLKRVFDDSLSQSLNEKIAKEILKISQLISLWEERLLSALLDAERTDYDNVRLELLLKKFGNLPNECTLPTDKNSSLVLALLKENMALREKQKEKPIQRQRLFEGKAPSGPSLRRLSF